MSLLSPQGLLRPFRWPQSPTAAALGAVPPPSCSISSSGQRAFHPSPPSSSSSRPTDHYAVLNLDRKASKKEIKERFYELSKKYHPDLRPNDEGAKAKYLEISAAYDTLGNASKRSAYDSSTFGRASPYSSPASPNLSRTGRQSTWVHPSTRMPPRAKGASGPSAAWSGRRQAGPSTSSSTGYSTGRESPFKGTAAGFGPYGHPDTLNASAWDRIAREEFSKPLRRTKPAFFAGAVPSRAELGREIHTEGLKRAFGLGMLLSIFLGLIAGVQGTVLWESSDGRATDRRRNDDDSRLARKRPTEAAAAAGVGEPTTRPAAVP